MAGRVHAERHACPPTTGPPSFLLVTLDTTRADHIGAYGAGFAITPTLDRLAREGILFEQAIAAITRSGSRITRSEHDRFRPRFRPVASGNEAASRPPPGNGPPGKDSA